jgi:hypothetical protein
MPVQGVPWLRGYPANGSSGAAVGGRPFGWQVITDGRRQMVWFIRLVDPPTVPTDSPPGFVPPPDRRAVLDVVALKGGLGTGCGPDPMILDGDKTWRLNRTTGRIEPVDRDDAACED